ncbi:uncharacterized protein Z520_08718 [Fonsecaea multimorphosa CBS 102226]|uniref:Uncharacterized protein n=1 Tax=Fonsecaea multimorphosa CBS 102226 TaxID=1442371 RepID=A0A0D2KFZ6_9EURO|nr:uncharacterized protein Z520_08718 [Fonsecaea multimorphosa CBS 102226]KIX95598.1 hypothetical protein Z520_08718 [Fonsecaea multimorphosa CBS 102226]OAL21203.1 hypothetical protein AYO22_08166 [Fonsecaea multimorphosa]
MPPRVRLRTLAQLAELQLEPPAYRYTCGRCSQRLYTTTSAAAASLATTPAPSDAQMRASIPTLSRYPPVQPPSHRNPAYRKSQLLRSYVSLLQTTPLIIFFQHNNLKATEWVSIRRELASALRKVDAQLAAQGKPTEELIGEYVKLQVIKTNMFEPALRIVEFFKPSPQPPEPIGGLAGIPSERDDPSLTHVLSVAAYEAAQQHKHEHPLTPVLAGSVAILTFPTVSPLYLKTAFSILSPQAPLFPAPTRRAVPQYYEQSVQDGLKKLMLLGARVDGQLFDMDGARWVGSIEGGIDGLRAQLVAMLQGFGAAMVQTLESGSRSLWFTMEGRRRMLEEGEEKPKDEEKKE